MLTKCLWEIREVCSREEFHRPASQYGMTGLHWAVLRWTGAGRTPPCPLAYPHSYPRCNEISEVINSKFNWLIGANQRPHSNSRLHRAGSRSRREKQRNTLEFQFFVVVVENNFLTTWLKSSLFFKSSAFKTLILEKSYQETHG